LGVERRATLLWDVRAVDYVSKDAPGQEPELIAGLDGKGNFPDMKWDEKCKVDMADFNCWYTICYYSMYVDWAKWTAENLPAISKVDLNRLIGDNVALAICVHDMPKVKYWEKEYTCGSGGDPKEYSGFMSKEEWDNLDEDTRKSKIIEYEMDRPHYCETSEGPDVDPENIRRDFMNIVFEDPDVKDDGELYEEPDEKAIDELKTWEKEHQDIHVPVERGDEEEFHSDDGSA